MDSVCLSLSLMLIFSSVVQLHTCCFSVLIKKKDQHGMVHISFLGGIILAYYALDAWGIVGMVRV